MKIIIALFYLITLLTIPAYAQTSNGKVSSLVAAENYFAGIAKEKGIKQAFLTVSDEHTILFRPDPVNALTFFNKKPSDPGLLSREPTFAKISKSGDWGFTTGPYVYKSAANSDKSNFGQYVSVWRMNKKGVWKLAIDLGISYPKPGTKPKLTFIDPKSSKFFNQRSVSRLKQQEDMIMITDKLFSTTLKDKKNLAYNVFLGDDARLLFPGFEPIIGKQNITDFLRYQQLQISTEPAQADRALGSDLAYTYGIASIVKNNKTSKYNYLRIWEPQDGHKWNVVLEILTPASLNF